MSEKIYRRLLSLYPGRFRREYGAAAADLFRGRLQAGAIRSAAGSRP